MSKLHSAPATLGALALLASASGCGEVVAGNPDAGDEPADAGDEIEDAGAADAGDDAGGATPDADAPEANVAFVTSDTYTGDLGGLDGADAICQQTAEDAGLSGTYVAWLSDNTISALARLGDARGWVRTDGKAFADTITDLTEGRIFYPLRVDEEGNDLAGSDPAGVWTGTLADGTADTSRCAEWSSAETNQQGDIGQMDTATGTWTDLARTSCDIERRLYCFGVDNEVEVAPEPVDGRLAFVTDAAFLPQGGLSAADQLCADEASSAGLDGSFKALLPVEGTSMADRFDTNGDTWIRPDGVAIAESANGLFVSQYWDAALNQSADGATYSQGTIVWSGATSPTETTSTATCGNWVQADSQLSALVGFVQYTKLRASGTIEGTFQNCGQSNRIRCLEE